MDESKELGVENEVSDDETDEPKEPAYHHDTTGDSPPWIKG